MVSLHSQGDAVGAGRIATQNRGTQTPSFWHHPVRKIRVALAFAPGGRGALAEGRGIPWQPRHGISRDRAWLNELRAMRAWSLGELDWFCWPSRYGLASRRRTGSASALGATTTTAWRWQGDGCTMGRMGNSRLPNPVQAVVATVCVLWSPPAPLVAGARAVGSAFPAVCRSYSDLDPSYFEHPRTRRTVLQRRRVPLRCDPVGRLAGVESFHYERRPREGPPDRQIPARPARTETGGRPRGVGCS